MILPFLARRGGRTVSSPPPPPVANITWTGDGEGGAIPTLSSATSTGTISSRAWALASSPYGAPSPGFPGTGTTIELDFSDATQGPYVANLTVTGPGGNSTKPVVIYKYNHPSQSTNISSPTANYPLMAAQGAGATDINVTVAAWASVFPTADYAIVWLNEDDGTTNLGNKVLAAPGNDSFGNLTPETTYTLNANFYEQLGGSPDPENDTQIGDSSPLLRFTTDPE